MKMKTCLKLKNRTCKFKRMLTKKEDLWKDSETDTSSTSDRDYTRKSSKILPVSDSEVSSDENKEFPIEKCCLVCSILPSVSKINTCDEHFKLLIQSITSKTIKSPKNNNARSKVKYQYQSDTSSSLSTNRRHRKRQLMILKSSDSSSQDDVFFSPDVQTQEIIKSNQEHRTNHIETQLSSSTVDTTLEQYHEISLSVLENNSQIQSVWTDAQNESLKDELFQKNHDTNKTINSSNLSRDVNDDSNQQESVMNIDARNEQNSTNVYDRPIILLQRVQFAL